MPRVSRSARSVIDYLYFSKFDIAKFDKRNFATLAGSLNHCTLGSLNTVKESNLCTLAANYVARRGKGGKNHWLSKNSVTLSLPFLLFFFTAFHLIRLNSQLWRISFFFSLLTHFFSPDGVHSKTTLFLFVTSLLHTLILHPSSPLPSSPKLALMFSVFNHCSTALFALSHSLSLFLPLSPLHCWVRAKRVALCYTLPQLRRPNSGCGKVIVRMF